MLFQGLVTQTHAHFGLDGTSIAAASTRVTSVAADGQKDNPAAPACPLCEEKALFGAYLIGGSATIAAPLVSTYQFAAASLPLLVLRASSHAWRSRAPPTFTA
jgi:hypothetical protein